jgi:hypothetical protein
MKELRAGGEGGIVRLRATRFGEISFLSASHLAIARSAIQSERRRMAERVGFAPQLGIENTELKGFSLPRDPLDPHESPGGDTY